MSEEQHVYEIDVIVRGHNKPDTVISREYVTSKASPATGPSARPRGILTVSALPTRQRQATSE